MRCRLEELFATPDLFKSFIKDNINGTPLVSFTNYTSMLMGLNSTKTNETLDFLAVAIYGYFYNNLIAYEYDPDVLIWKDAMKLILAQRMCYDIAVKLPYWVKKYNMIKKLLTTEDLSLLQTSKVSSSSSDATHSAGGTLQKGATTPTGVTAETSPDEININMDDNEGTRENSVETNGFVDKYTNHQQKFVNASEVKGEREGEILREGSIDELLNILEKLPASFSDEITRDLQKHFIFDYEGEERGLYA